jgi:hypothetical protein
MNRRLLVPTVTALAVVFSATMVLAKEPTSPGPPAIQIALLLDTSNSMDGLIAQAKTQLWTIVNEFVKARRDGRPPRIEVALYEYGNNRLSPANGYVRRVLPLSDDLDKVSEELFSLSTNGGEEYCGQVISDAVADLSWSSSANVYRAIFIAGNEPFSQGTVDYHASCKRAIERGILVNTIFCGPVAEGARTGWKDGALLADGRYLSIDQNHQIVDIPTPQDAEITRLNTELNATYLPYGKLGREGQARQGAQDANAVANSQGTLVNRSISKCTSFYCPSDWDLVDAIKTGKCTLDSIKDEELPEALRPLNKSERQARIDAAGKRREEIRKQVLTLNATRERFLAAERAKQAGPGQATLDAAIVEVIRDQAGRRDFRFE